jgi:hypothetical protein
MAASSHVSGELNPAKQTVTLDFESHDGTPVTLRAHAGFAVEETVAENGRALEWEDDPETGIWNAKIEAERRIPGRPSPGTGPKGYPMCLPPHQCRRAVGRG